MGQYSISIVQGDTVLQFSTAKSRDKSCDLRKAVNIGIRNILRAVKTMEQHRVAYKQANDGKNWTGCPLKWNKPVKFQVHLDDQILVDSDHLKTRGFIDFTARPQNIENIGFNLRAAVEIVEMLGTPDVSGSED